MKTAGYAVGVVAKQETRAQVPGVATVEKLMVISSVKNTRIRAEL